MRRVALFGLVVAAVLVATATPSAQTATGQITGSVKDSSGAVIRKVKVAVTNQETGLTRSTTTNEDGDYVVPLLPVGRYVVTAEQAGFKVAARSDVSLNVDQIQRVDLQLETGNLTETVEVKAAAVALDTGSASVGQTITEKQVTELPLNGRNFIQLLFLGAGAVETNGEQSDMRQGVGSAISIMGSRPTSNNFMIDGTSNVDTALGTPAAILSVDAIQEFKEQTTTYSAEYGFSANQINLVSKSGTNTFHGTGFGFMRKDAFDARNFFDSPTADKPQLDQKQFGGVIGGPVWRNRTFFLFNYEGTRITRGFNSFYTVPNPENLAGHFSTPITDPLTGQPFPNNTIPQSRFSRVAQLALRSNWYPAPNSSAAQGNYQLVRTLPQEQDQYTVRIDHTLGRFGQVFGRYTKTTYSNRTNHNVLEIGDQVFEQDTKNWQVSHTWALKSNLVNQFRVGRIEARADQRGIPCAQSDVDFLALKGVFTNLPDIQRECPLISIQGYAGTGGAGNAYSASNQPMWDLGNTTTYVAGRHNLNFGFNFRRWQLQRDLATGFLGEYDFRVGFSGNPIADMLLGYYTAARLFQPAAFSVPGRPGNPREFNFLYVAPYVQDDWHATSRLTVNLGLRWDYRNTPYETRNRMAWRNLDYAPGGLLVADQTLATGGIVDGKYYQLADTRSPVNPDRFKVFAPRLGFAWRLTEDAKSVLRGGYGVFFDSSEGREIDGAADVYPYVSRGNYQQSAGQLAPLQTTDVLFPSFEAPGVATPAANTFLAVSQSPEPRNPYVQQWSLGVQRELFASTIVELNYIGNKGTNLLMRRNIAQALPYDPSRPTVAERKPYPNFGVYIDSDWSGRSNFNAQRQARAPGPLGAFDVRLHLGQEHRFQVCGRGHRLQ